MNKEEKIGMYTRNEIFEHLCENSNIGMLGRSMYDAVMSKIDNLQSQLDIANKKLDKIKEIINSFLDNWECGGALTEYHITGEPPSKDLQDILSIIGGE